jgi:hypothetical protein
MNMTFNSPVDGAYFVLATLFSTFVVIFWMFVGWRAMRAHERLAVAIEKLAPQEPRKPLPRVSDGPIGAVAPTA